MGFALISYGFISIIPTSDQMKTRGRQRTPGILCARLLLVLGDVMLPFRLHLHLGCGLKGIPLPLQTGTADQSPFPGKEKEKGEEPNEKKLGLYACPVSR